MQICICKKYFSTFAFDEGNILTTHFIKTDGRTRKDRQQRGRIFKSY